MRWEDGAQRGSSPSWLWPGAKSPHHSCTLTQLTFLNEKRGRHIATPNPPHTHTPDPFPTLTACLKSTGPSSPLHVKSITYCNVCLPHCITLLCNNVNACEQSACYIHSTLQKETKHIPSYPRTGFKKEKKKSPNQPELLLICWTTAPACGQHHVCFKCVFLEGSLNITSYFVFPSGSVRCTQHPQHHQKYRDFILKSEVIWKYLCVHLRVSEVHRPTNKSFGIKSTELINWSNLLILHVSLFILQRKNQHKAHKNRWSLHSL